MTPLPLIRSKETTSCTPLAPNVALIPSPREQHLMHRLAIILTRQGQLPKDLPNEQWGRGLIEMEGRWGWLCATNIIRDTRLKSCTLERDK